MSSLDKLFIISLIVIAIGFGLVGLDVQKTSYNKGVRDGYHRGRAIKEGRPDIIAVPSDLKEVKE